MSFRDIGTILKKASNGSGNGMTYHQQQSNGSNQSHNEKATHAYELFSEGKTPGKVVIQLSLSEKEATRYYTEYWRLKGLYGLYDIYQESKGDPSYIMKLCRIAKRQGITADNIEWFVNMVDIGTFNIPELQKQYAKLQDEYKSLTTKRWCQKQSWII